MFKIIAVGIMSAILYVGITSFDSLINLKVDVINETEQGFERPLGVVSAEETQVSTEQVPPTAQELKQVAEIFFQELIQRTNDEGLVLKYDNKLELKHHLTELASLHVVSYYVDGLYEEQQGKLFIIPMDSPPWLEQENPAELFKVSDDEYILSQTNNSELHGNYKITISFKQMDGHWLITNVQIGKAI